MSVNMKENAHKMTTMKLNAQNNAIVQLQIKCNQLQSAHN